MKVIATLAVGDYLRWGNELTIPAIRAYAEKYGWDFVLVDHLERPINGYSDYVWEMVGWFYDLLGKYDRLLSIPVDSIIKSDARDISELPIGTFYGMDELPVDTSPYNMHYGKKIWEYSMEEWPDEFPKSADFPKHLYNTGPMLVDQSHRELFKKPSKEPNHGMLEMALVNMRLHKYGMAHQDLRPEWFNASHIWFADQPRPDILHIMHFGGTKDDGVKSFMPLMGYSC
jgi:hypothetical protein